jgi:hypothetical protein
MGASGRGPRLVVKPVIHLRIAEVFRGIEALHATIDIETGVISKPEPEWPIVAISSRQTKRMAGPQFSIPNR